jgi:hypothetical protein
MLLSKMIDSTVRGIVYEAAGSAPEQLLASGSRRVIAFCEDSRVPYALLRTGTADYDGWLAEALEALDVALGSRPQAGARLATTEK